MDERPKCETGVQQNTIGEQQAATSLTMAAATSCWIRLQRQGKQKQK